MPETIKLQAGSLAYYDSFDGLVPCRITTVDRDASGLRVLITFTARRGTRARGHQVDTTTTHVWPRQLRRVRGSYGHRVIVPPHEFIVTRGA